MDVLLGQTFQECMSLHVLYPLYVTDFDIYKGLIGSLKKPVLQQWLKKKKSNFHK